VQEEIKKKPTVFMKNSNTHLPAHIILARDLRKNQTASEANMWNKLRNRRLLGFKFNRQYPILFSGNNDRTNFFITDFYCAEKKLVIEIDGPIHACQQ
jgi:very-short-patch-repair endonuclease